VPDHCREFPAHGLAEMSIGDRHRFHKRRSTNRKGNHIRVVDYSRLHPGTVRTMGIAGTASPPWHKSIEHILAAGSDMAWLDRTKRAFIPLSRTGTSPSAADVVAAGDTVDMAFHTGPVP
jgi:hypothetical protein